MHQYEVIIYYSQENEAYIAEVPDLPGCMADGATKYEALQSAEIAVTEWIETAKLMGREIPQPRGKLQ
jgi:predicted RNase H-like HicB family nuclease